MIQEHWATVEDFATLFQYFWYCEFPVTRINLGARRVDWTKHIDSVVRQIGDRLGFVTRYERGGKKDAVLRSTKGDEIAIEWEWENTWEKELKKLRNDNIWKSGQLKFAVLITYSEETTIELLEKEYEKVKNIWVQASWPLLLILIQYTKSDKYSSDREFTHITMSKIYGHGEISRLRSTAAVPWNVPTTRWSQE